MKLTVLWIDNKNGNGICVDENKNEYYIDSSISGFNLLARKDCFESNEQKRVGGVLCVREVGDIKHFKV